MPPHLRPEAVLAATGATGADVVRVALDGDGTYCLGPLEVRIDGLGTPGGCTWSVANRGDTPVPVRRVALVFAAGHTGTLRMFRHGYQSWSPCDVAVVGVDDDPVRTNTTGIEQFNGAHHADQRTPPAGQLRSECVTVFADGTGCTLAGFEVGVAPDGSLHDGTLRAAAVPGGGAVVEAEAFLGGAVLSPGAVRHLHRVVFATGDTPGPLLAGWAHQVGAAAGARTGAPFQVGWCSWYHYFHDVTAADIAANLAAAGDWPFDVFQVDDGYQSAIGDWLTTNDRFPGGVDAMAADIAGRGVDPGIWVAPFICAPDSVVATTNPGWLAGDLVGGGPLVGMFNPPWGGGLEGIMWALDTTRPEVLAHLEDTARHLTDVGYTYLKLDFTFAPAFDGVFSEAAATPAERVRAGFDAVRRGAGDDTFILGCGAPIGHVIGAVDGMRIGADVAPGWNLDPARVGEPEPGALPATAHAVRNTLARSFMHRALWLNDPDCVMLRTTDTDLTAEQVRTWAQVVGASGGMVLVSDALANLGDSARELLGEVTALGREADAGARAGQAPVCDDLLAVNPGGPTTLTAAGRRLVVDPVSGASHLVVLG